MSGNQLPFHNIGLVVHCFPLLVSETNINTGSNNKQCVKQEAPSNERSWWLGGILLLIAFGCALFGCFMIGSTLFSGYSLGIALMRFTTGCLGLILSFYFTWHSFTLIFGFGV